MTKVQVLAEHGGIGDLLGRLGVAQAIKRAVPDAVVWFVIDNRLREWVQQLDNQIDHIVGVDPHARRPISKPRKLRKYPYLTVGGRFDYVVDLACPSYSEETYWLAHRPLRPRQHVWAGVAERALGIAFPDTLPRLTPIEPHFSRAQEWVKRRFAEHPGPLIGLHPFSCWTARTLSYEQLAGVVAALGSLEPRYALFHSKRYPTHQWAHEIAATPIVRPQPASLAGLIQGCDVLLGADSGLLHLASCVGTPAVGVFGCTGGERVLGAYPSAAWVDAGPQEFDGLPCQEPCYGHNGKGMRLSRCDNRPCLALGRIAPQRIANAVTDVLRRTTMPVARIDNRDCQS